MVIEVVTFRARDGVTAEKVAAADTRLQTECALLQPGFVRRTVGHGAGRDWVIVTFWDSHADAVRAWAMQHPAADAFVALGEEDSWHVERYEALP